MRKSSAIVLIITIIFSWGTGHANAQIMRSKNYEAPAAKQVREVRWPTPSQLLKELSIFEEHAITANWAARTKETVEILCTETEVTSEQAVELLMALSQQSNATATLISRISQGRSAGTYGPESLELVTELQRFRYRMDRRLKIWAGVVDHANALNALNAKEASPVKPASLSWLPENLDELLEAQIPGNTGWQKYLAWDDLISASRTINMDEKAKITLRKTAQKFLSRYHSPSLTDAQRDLFQPYFATDVLADIRAVASDDVDHTRIMRVIEGLEEQPNRGDYATFLNRQYQNLLWSDDPIAHELAGTIDSHWRNANFRIAINERMLNQMLPQVPATTEPVSENLQGAKISGQSLIQTDQLRIALIPNPNEISLAVETVGQVTSDTVAKRSGFTFQNQGLADFRVLQKLAFSRTGVTSEAPEATSSARQKLIGLRGSYDRVPLLGWLTRKIAKKKADEQTPEANALTRERVETGAKQRVESEVNQMVNQFRRGLHQHVLSRLIAMDLEPETVQLSTSQERIVGRYRIAGRDQMAAWQPRPTDHESDLLTVQLHQSAMNNLVQRFGLNDQEFDVTSFGKHIEKVTGIPYAPKNVETEATFKFDKYDAIRVDFEDGIASVKFAFKRFQIGKGRPWKDITVKAEFEPTYVGSRIVLNRSNPFVVESKKRSLRFADEIAIRAAFTVILEKQYALDLLPAVVREKVPALSLGIDRLSLAKGWCGVTFANAAELGQTVPIVTPEEVITGTWPGKVSSLQTEDVSR